MEIHPFPIGNTTSNGGFSIAMLVYQRVPSNIVQRNPDPQIEMTVYFEGPGPYAGSFTLPFLGPIILKGINPPTYKDGPILVRKWSYITRINGHINALLELKHPKKMELQAPTCDRQPPIL